MRLVSVLITAGAIAACASRSSPTLPFQTTPPLAASSASIVVAPSSQGQPEVPDYHGLWFAVARVRSCFESGFFEALRPTFCSRYPDGGVGTLAVFLVQGEESTMAELDLDEILLFPEARVRVATNGSLSFTTTWFEELSGLTVEMAVRLESRNNDLKGTITETWRVPGLPGEGRVVKDIARATRWARPQDWLESTVRPSAQDHAEMIRPYGR